MDKAKAAGIEDRNSISINVPKGLPDLPGHLGQVSTLDIPKKYFVEKECLPHHGLCIDATFKEIRNCLGYIRDIQESDRRKLQKQIGWLFSP